MGAPEISLSPTHPFSHSSPTEVQMQFEEAVAYVHSLGETDMKLGLERFTALCERLGNPQEKLRTIHVAGTNGKGSVTAMVSSILKHAGYKVGSYYSPFVYDIRERFQINSEMISKEDFTRLVNFIRPHAVALAETEHGHPTEFEIKTAIAFLYFVEQGVDFAVLEVGLGGRLDATNIVNPLVSVITNVSLDHMDRLGDTIAEIAGEKAGIIKRNVPLVTAAEGEALDVIRRACEERNSELRLVHPLNGDLKLGMKGEFQQINAATAIKAVEILREKGINISEEAVRTGLEKAYLPGRLEVLREKPTLMIDGAHNLDGAQKLIHALKEWFTYDKLILVMGMVSGHSVEDVVGTLAPHADKFITTAPQSIRAASAASITEVAEKHCTDVEQVEPVSEAVRRALEIAGEDDLICVTGSFYTIGEARR